MLYVCRITCFINDDLPTRASSSTKYSLILTANSSARLGFLDTYTVGESKGCSTQSYKPQYIHNITQSYTNPNIYPYISFILYQVLKIDLLFSCVMLSISIKYFFKHFIRQQLIQIYN